MGRRKYITVILLCAVLAGIFVTSGAAAQEEGPEGMKLVRFDLHKSSNKEVGLPAGLPGFFTYYYEGKEYQYSFHFDKNGTGTESQTFGTAYVWAPYSVIYYDAAGGKIERLGTAVWADEELAASRGGGEYLQKGSYEKSGKRYAADYTVYGNSLELSEGRMPAAMRKGYVFLGWYYRTNGGKVQEEELKTLASQEKFAALARQLNRQFTEKTKILEDVNKPAAPAREITVYAKWEKIAGE